MTPPGPGKSWCHIQSHTLPSASGASGDLPGLEQLLAGEAVGLTDRPGHASTSFGLTLIGGLTTATLLTLLVVPVFYTFFDDAQLVTGRAIRHALGAEPRGESAEA